MNLADYLKLCNDHLEKFFLTFRADSNHENYFSFLNCQRNLRHYLGITSEQEVASFFRQLMGSISLASNDQLSGAGVEVSKIINNSDSLPFLPSPAIYCTYHIEAFRLVPHLLATKNIDFVLVVDQKTYDNQLSLYEKAYEQSNVEGKISFSVLSAEDPAIGLKLIRAIKGGVSVLFYIDGNSGVGGMGRNDDKLTKIQFLGKSIWARKGIAFLSYATGAPIFPIVSIRDESYAPYFILEQPISIAKERSREEILNSVTSQLFSVLESYLSDVPAQWEGWLYLHLFETDRSMPVGTPMHSFSRDKSASVVFDVEKFDFFHKDGAWHLFDKEDAFVWPISDSLYKVLSVLRGSAMPFSLVSDVMPPKLFAEMFSLGVLKPLNVALV